MTKKIFTVIIGLFLLPFFATAADRSEINIDKTGKVSAKNIKVTLVSDPGKSKFFYARAVWDDIFIRMTILTNDSTIITKEYGERTTVFDIKEGDILDIEGTLPNGSSSFNIQATKIVDHSLLREELEVKGDVTAVSAPASFTIKTAKGNIATINTSHSPAIKKGVRIISPYDISVGDKILSIKGTFDYATSIMDATDIEVYQDKSVFIPRNFQGVLKNISGTVFPTTITALVGAKEYTVYLNEKTEVLNKNRTRVGFNRFVSGDTIRFYGTIRQTDLSAIDAEVIRDLNF